MEFSIEEYEAICSNSQEGKIKELIECLAMYDPGSFGPTTFCPDPKRHIGAPVILAAQYGQLEIVTYLVERFKGIIDVDHSATIVSRTTKKKVHHATALWAASTGGHLNIVMFLVSKGADVNKTTLTRSTPLRGASFHGFLDIMEFLIVSGADINTPNCIGQSPLCIAAMRGEVQAVKFLMERGADVNQTTINSYTVMHLAAAKGKDEVIKLLLDRGVSPQFQEADSRTSGYVPCPLFLAASTGQTKAAQVLLDHKDCSLSCKSDAHLLLASMQCELRKRLRVTEPRIQAYWEEGLRIREKENITPHYLDPIPEYGDRTEIKTIEELSSSWFDVDFNRRDVFYQSLIIRERCMGFYDQGLIYFLIRRGLYFCHERRYQEAELLWKRAMKMEIMVCEMEISHPTFGHCEGTMRDMEKDLNVYSEGVCTMVKDNYMPNFSGYINYGLEVLTLISRLGSKADSEVLSQSPILGLVMELFLSWIIYSSPDSQYGWSRECEKLGQEFVSRHLHYIPGTTLLHLALTNFEVSENDDRKVLDRFSDLRPLVTALLSWGADEVIDKPNGEGRRPVHVAMETQLLNSIELLSPLIEGGAHIDAVDSDGDTVYDMCSLEEQKVLLYSCGPASLACYSARAIIKLNIEFSSLPNRVQQFVRIHDPKCVVTA